MAAPRAEWVKSFRRSDWSLSTDCLTCKASWKSLVCSPARAFSPSTTQVQCLWRCPSRLMWLPA